MALTLAQAMAKKLTPKVNTGSKKIKKGGGSSFAKAPLRPPNALRPRTPRQGVKVACENKVGASQIRPLHQTTVPSNTKAAFMLLPHTEPGREGEREEEWPEAQEAGGKGGALRSCQAPASQNQRSHQKPSLLLPSINPLREEGRRGTRRRSCFPSNAWSCTTRPTQQPTAA